MQMTATATTLGEGVLNWSRYERIGDRYGAIHLSDSPDSEAYATWDDAPAGTLGTLVAHILQTRQSRHIGDFFRGIGPSVPEPGEEITLGRGTLFTQVDGGVPVIGVEPEDGRETDWMDPRALYRCHEQTVRLEFRPDAEPAQALALGPPAAGGP
jgi:hypothetical protein